jgi:hypothetical protein
MWHDSRDSAAKHVADLRGDFVGSFRRSIEEVVYFPTFATDLRYPPHSNGTAEI